MTINFEELEASLDLSNSSNTAFSSKWAELVDPEVFEIIEAWVAQMHTTDKSKKAIASYKSLTTRYMATGIYSEGKSGDSQKSAVKSFMRFRKNLLEAIDIFGEIDEIDESDELDEID